MQFVWFIEYILIRIDLKVLKELITLILANLIEFNFLLNLNNYFAESENKKTLRCKSSNDESREDTGWVRT